MDKLICTTIVGTGSYIPSRKIPNTHFLDHEFYDIDGTRFERTNQEIIEKFEAITGIKEESKFWFCGLREVVELTSKSAQVLAEFIDYPPMQVRSPAVVANDYGEGKALYFAAGLGEAYVKMEMPYLRQVIAGLMRWLNVDVMVEVEGISEEASQDLEITVLDAKVDADRTVVVINHGEEGVDSIDCWLAAMGKALKEEDVKERVLEY